MTAFFGRPIFFGPSFRPSLSFDRKTEAVGAVDALMLKDD